MKAFTSMSAAGINAVIDAQREDFASNGQYEIGLNPSDFQNLVLSLKITYERAMSPELSDWAASYLGGIAQTLGIEFI